MTAERKASQGRCFCKNRKPNSRRFGHTDRALSAGQIGFTHGVEDAGAEKIGRRVGLGACALSDRSDTDTREQIRMKAKLSTKGWERSRRADRNFALATIALMVFFLVAGFTGWMLGTPSLGGNHRSQCDCLIVFDGAGGGSRKIPSSPALHRVGN